jgi:hypothetical protein
MLTLLGQVSFHCFNTIPEQKGMVFYLLMICLLEIYGVTIIGGIGK